MAEVKKIGGATVNDGRGLWDNEGLIDTMLTDLNDLMKCMAAGQYIRYADITVKFVQKLNNLKKGMKAELKDKEDQIADLQRLNNELAEKAFGVPVDTESIPAEEFEKSIQEGNDDGGNH